MSDSTNNNDNVLNYAILAMNVSFIYIDSVL